MFHWTSQYKNKRELFHIQMRCVWFSSCYLIEKRSSNNNLKHNLKKATEECLQVAAKHSFASIGARRSNWWRHRSALNGVRLTSIQFNPTSLSRFVRFNLCHFCDDTNSQAELKCVMLSSVTTNQPPNSRKEAIAELLPSDCCQFIALSKTLISS